MGSHVYNKVSEELVEKFKKIVPGKVYTKDEINQDFFHDEMPIYGEGEPEVVRCNNYRSYFRNYEIML